jgi:hypothetical protein
LEVKEQYQIEILYMFAALENFDENVDVSRAWESIRENVKSFCHRQSRLL